MYIVQQYTFMKFYPASLYRCPVLLADANFILRGLNGVACWVKFHKSVLWNGHDVTFRSVQQ